MPPDVSQSLEDLRRTHGPGLPFDAGTGFSDASPPGLIVILSGVVHLFHAGGDGRRLPLFSCRAGEVFPEGTGLLAVGEGPGKYLRVPATATQSGSSQGEFFPQALARCARSLSKGLQDLPTTAGMVLAPPEAGSDGLQSWVEKAKELLTSWRRLHDQDESQRYLLASDERRRAISEGLGYFSRLTDPADPLPVRGAGLHRVLRILGKAMAMDFDGADTGTEELEDICINSGVRRRELHLRGEWLRRSSSPLLGFRQEDDAPVALLPGSFGRWWCVDEQGNRQRLRPGDENLFLERAIMFYRPLPATHLRSGDLLRYALKGNRADLRTLLFMSVAIGILGLLTPLATGLVYDEILPGADYAGLWQLGAALLIAALAVAAFQFTQGLAVNRLEALISAPLEAALWDRVINLPPAFFRRFSSGNLASRLFAIRQVHQLITGAVVTAGLGVFAGLFNFLLMFTVDLRLAGAACAFAVVLLLVVSTGLRRQLIHFRALAAVDNDLSAHTLQIVRAIGRIRTNGSGPWAFRSWAGLYAKKKFHALRAGTIANRVNAFNRSFPALALAGFIMVVMGMDHGSITIGAFLKFSAAFSVFLAAALSLSNAALNVGLALPALEQLQPVLEELPEVHEKRRDPGELRGKISLDGVSFAYEERGRPIIDNLSLEVPAGSFTAIVGPSGAGKSTLLRLLLGFEQPTAGTIRYDDQELHHIDIIRLRRQLGVVLQNGRIMPGTIMENIVGATGCSRDQAVQAATIAGLHADVEAMPMGYETYIREGLMSGGQQQRLLIARAVVNRPRILFFDEATSALDNRTQQVVTEAIAALNATRVVIAHRLSTIRHADQIIVLAEGRVMEQGTYDSLMAADGLFARLASRQL